MRQKVPIEHQNWKCLGIPSTFPNKSVTKNHKSVHGKREFASERSFDQSRKNKYRNLICKDRNKKRRDYL